MFTYVCPLCERKLREVRRVERPLCPDCETPMDRDYSAMRISINTGQLDYVLDLASGHVRVQTLRQQERIMQENDIYRPASDECTGTKKFGRDKPVETELSRDKKRVEWKDGIQKATAELKAKGYRMPTESQRRKMPKGTAPLAF